MLKRFRRHLNPPMVVATIALFAALGGGYATAFSGSGTLQKAGMTGVSTSFQNLRSLNGFGTLQVRCDTGDDEFEYQFVKSTSADVAIQSFRESDAADVRQVFDGGVGETGTLLNGSGGIQGTMRLHLFKLGTKQGVDVVTSNDGPQGDNCTTAFVQIMALNTQG